MHQLYERNKRLNPGIDEDHTIFSTECPIYENKLILKKRMIGLDIWQPKKIHGICTNI